MLSNLEDLAIFSAIVDAGSLSGAAAKLSIPKSRISRRLALLEQQIGSQLMIRTTRSLRLTESGRLLYQRCHPHIEALNRVEEEVGSLITEPRGRLHLLFPLEFFNRLISHMVSEFARLYPKIELHCSHYSGEVPTNIDPIDLAFVLHESPLPPSDWIARSLLSFPQSIYAARGRDTSDLQSPEDLTRQPCILNTDEQQWLFRDNDKIQAVPVEGRMYLSSPQMRIEAASQDLGLVKLPDYLCQDSGFACQLSRVELSHDPQAQELSVLYQSRSVPIKTRTFLEFFQSHLGQLS